MTATESKISRIKELTDKLNSNGIVDYLFNKKESEIKETLKELQSVIKQEREMIKHLPKDSFKLKHYNSVLSSLLSIISSVKGIA